MFYVEVLVIWKPALIKIGPLRFIVMLTSERWHVEYKLLVLATTELKTLEKRLLAERLLAGNSLPVQP